MVNPNCDSFIREIPGATNFLSIINWLQFNLKIQIDLFLLLVLKVHQRTGKWKNFVHLGILVGTTTFFLDCAISSNL
jgi:hypothetical protein